MPLPTGVGLALLRERERAGDLLLRVRVVDHVARKACDRIAIAVQGVDLADAPVVVPVGHDLIAARGVFLRGRHARQQRDEGDPEGEREKHARERTGLEDSVHDGMRRRYPTKEVQFRGHP